MTRKRVARRFDRGFQRAREDEGLRELAEVRRPLLLELEVLRPGPEYAGGGPAHVCCTRKFNQMLISPLEARAIAEAFRREPHLRRKLPGVLARLRRELRGLRDTDERQSFDCPLLEGTRCLVHEVAKPIGCLAWHPRPSGLTREGFTYTRQGWKAFERRDQLNNEVFGPSWKARVIPLWLKRVFARQLERGRMPEGGREVDRERDRAPAREGGREIGHGRPGARVQRERAPP